MRKQKPRVFRVTMPVMPGVTVAQMQYYIRVAVQGWCGESYEDDDWRTDLQDLRDKIKVTLLREKTKV